jgi:hypothetical protein
LHTKSRAFEDPPGNTFVAGIEAESLRLTSAVILAISIIGFERGQARELGYGNVIHYYELKYFFSERS